MIKEQVIERPKKTWEVFNLSVDFSDNINTGEEIDSENSEVTVDLVVRQNEYTDVTASMVYGSSAVQGSKVVAAIQNGISGNKYKVRFRAYISATKQIEEVLNLTVQD